MAGNIKYTRALVLSDDTFEFSGRNPAKVAGIDGQEEQAARALQGLNELQRRGKGSISAVSLSCGLQYLLKQAPLTTVSLIPPEECDIFADGEEMDDFRPVRRALKSADWLLWVVDTGHRHYVVIIVHLDPLTKDQKLRKSKRTKRQVRAWAVVDPTGDHGSAPRTRRVTDRLRETMRTPRLRERVDGFDGPTERSLAVSALPGHGVWASGLRAFALVDAVLQRLAARAFRAAAVWAPAPRPFNGVRAHNDLMTACAHQARQATGWRLRLALAPVRTAPKGSKKGSETHRSAHEERFEPARGFGYSPNNAWSSDEAESEAGTPMRPATPSSAGPPFRAPSPPPAPRKKRKTYRKPRVMTDDENETEPAPKRRKSSHPPSLQGSPVGHIVAQKSPVFASAASVACPTPGDGFIEPNQGPVDGNGATQALGDDYAPCDTDEFTSLGSMFPAEDTPASAEDNTMLDAPTVPDTVPKSPSSEEEWRR